MIKGSASRLAPSFSRYSPSVQPSSKVYCPVCGTDYPSDQTDAHIMKHTLVSSKVKKEPLPSVVSPLPSNQNVAYPMIEPLQFSTFDLGQVIKKDSYRLGHQQLNRKKPKLVKMVDCETQTLDRPLLQQMGQETDLCNCFDNIFTGGNLSEDLLGNNAGIASKRNLTEWQRARLSN